MIHYRVYTCDVCGADRKDVNHWYVVARSAGRCYVLTWAQGVRNRMVNRSTTRHACGRECAHKELDAMMSESIDVVRVIRA